MCYAGPPSEPGDLSSDGDPVSNGILVLSWSPPWVPDGVQLNYTVTVTNTNTSVVTVFTTSDTNITLTRDNITSVNSSSSSSSSQCDQYVWSVIQLVSVYLVNTPLWYSFSHAGLEIAMS